MALLTDSLTIPAAGSVNSTGTGAAQRQLSVAGGRSVVPLVYGEDRIGALLLNVLPSANAGFIAVQCLWGFAVDSVLDVRLNDNALSAGSTLTTYTGAQVSVDPVMSMAFAAQSITYTQALTGFAYSVITIPTREFDGTLNITARVRGRRLYDPRKDSTAGGAGLHRLATPSTWEWSDNPALALGDFCASTVYGAGVAVDWTSVATTANACDALIGAPAEKRRTLGVSFQQPADVNAVAETLRAYAGCFLLPAAAGVKLLPDQNDAPVASYSHAAGDIAALEPLQLRDMGQVPTAVEVIYTDTSKLPWRDATAVATLAGAGTTRPYRLSQVRLPGVQRYSQALREATERLNKLALQDLTTAIEVFDIGLRHDLGDIVTVTHPAGLSAEPLRVTGITMPGPGRWRLALVRHSAAAYSSAVVTLAASADPSRTALPGPPANVAGLSGTVAQGIITWTWTGATERDYAETQIRLGGTDWASAAPLWAGRGTGYLQRVSATGTYTLRARHVLQDGQLSVGTTSTAVTVAAGDLVQSEPGAPGQSQVVVELYQWGSASQPADPSGTTSYNWSNALHSSYTGGNGWSVTVPANPGTAGTRLWIARKALSAAVGTATSSVSWTGGFTVLAAAINGSQGPTGSTGAAGSPGIKAATPTVWRWAASIPTISGTGTYTWSAADTGLVPSGWSSVPGAGSPGQTLYGASVQLVDAAGATTTPIDWSTASITARGYAGTNGSNGSNGATGATGQAGVSARRAYVLTTASSLGSGSVSSTGPSSLPANGSFGASSWASTPATPATGQVLYQSDGLYDPATNLITWTTPYISALKVGNLAALAVNTGALTVDGNITVSASGGVFSSNYAAGSTGWALTPTGAEFGAASIRGQLTASQINTNGLVIRDNAGNPMFGVGTNLAASFINPASNWLNGNITVSGGVLNGIGTAGVQVDNSAQQWAQVQNRPPEESIRNNLIDLSWWRRGGTMPWAPNFGSGGVGQALFGCAPTGTADLPLGTFGPLPGPRGGNDVVLYAQEQSSNGDEAGGWNSGTFVAPLDPSKTYRFVVPIRKLSGGATAYWGTGNVCNLNTTSQSGDATNPYFAAAGLPQTDRWYLFVGYVYPFGSTGNTNDSAGIWDCKTGQKIAGGTNWNHAATGASAHRAYQFYASLSAEQIFGRPMVNLVDGTEPSLREYFEQGAVLNSDLGINASGQLVGIGAGNGTTIANSQIGINASGQFYGGGAGTGIPVSNNQITLGSDGRLNGIGAGAGTSVANDLVVAGVRRIPHPGGGVLNSDLPTQNGAIWIVLPVGWNYSMLRFDLEVFEYLTGAVQTYSIAGYNYDEGNGNQYWVNASATYSGDPARVRRVTFGKDTATGRPMVGIGAFVGSWSYPKVKVSNVVVGHSGHTDPAWGNEWSLTWETSRGYTEHSFIASPRPGGAMSGIDQITAGNASTFIANAAIGTAQIGAAAIGIAQINTATIGNVQALNAFTGQLTVDATGHIKGGATAYDFAGGNGFWLGNDGGTYKFRIGSAAQHVRWTGTALEVKLNAVVPSANTLTGSSFPVSSSIVRNLVTSTATATGGTPPYTFQWALTAVGIEDGGAANALNYGTISVSGAACTFLARGANNCLIAVIASCTVTDANGLSATIQRSSSGTFGSGPP